MLMLQATYPIIQRESHTKNWPQAACLKFMACDWWLGLLPRKIRVSHADNHLFALPIAVEAILTGPICPRCLTYPQLQLGLTG